MQLAEFICLLMLTGVVALLMTGIPVAFVLAGTALGFALAGNAMGVFDLTLLGAFPQRVFATMSAEIWIAVPLFILMGVALERSRTARDLLEAMGGLFGRFPGGMAYAVSIVGMLMAASTGIVGATVVTMGLLALPVMLKRGYGAAFSCGSIAACGTLGQIIPPSIILVLLADQLSIAYQTAQFDLGISAPETITVKELFAGALVPGLMLVALYIGFQIFYARLRPDRAPPMREAAERASFGQLCRVLFAPVFLIVAVLGSILSGIAPAVEASSVGAVGALMLAGHKVAARGRAAITIGLLAWLVLFVLAIAFDLREARAGGGAFVVVRSAVAFILTGLGVAGLAVALRALFSAPGSEGGGRLLPEIIRATLVLSAMIFAIVIGASLFALVLRGFGGDHMIERFLSDLPGGPAGALLTVMAVMFVMGFFLDFLEIMFIVVPVVAPVLLQMPPEAGFTITPVWLGVLFALNLQTSFLTPPFGFALFYLRGVAPPDVRTTDIYKGVAPFVALQLVALAIVWFIPHLATWLPEALYGL